jgi:hypothetical protein
MEQKYFLNAHPLVTAINSENDIYQVRYFILEKTPAFIWPGLLTY